MITGAQPKILLTQDKDGTLKMDALKKDAEYDEEETKDESRMLGCVMSFANFMTEAYEAEELLKYID